MRHTGFLARAQLQLAARPDTVYEAKDVRAPDLKVLLNFGFLRLFLPYATVEDLPLLSQLFNALDQLTVLRLQCGSLARHGDSYTLLHKSNLGRTGTWLRGHRPLPDHTAGSAELRVHNAPTREDVRQDTHFDMKAVAVAAVRPL
jgi:hypothetical protein